MSETVLVPVEDSPLAREALRYALTEHPQAAITALHVIDVYEPGYGGAPDVETTYEPLMGSEEWYERAREVSRRILEEAEEIAADHDRTVDTVSEVGDPREVIVDYADEEGIDHVVIGAHGRSEQRRPVYGSVTETVARRATVPVTIVR